jgi:hypothetical protein
MALIDDIDLLTGGLGSWSLQLFRVEAEPHVSAPSLQLFDQVIHDTAGKLKARTRTGEKSSPCVTPVVLLAIHVPRVSAILSRSSLSRQRTTRT